MLYHDKILIDLFFNEENKLNSNYWKFIKRIKKQKYENIKTYLLNRYDDLTISSKTILKESLYRILNHIENRIKCLTCGKFTSFNPLKENCYNDHCSRQCEMQDAEVMQKHNESCLKKYGSINNSQKCKQTKLQRYGDENYNNVEKRNNTNLEKYGNTCALQNAEIKEKTRQTNLIKYGNAIAQRNQDIRNKIKNSNINTCRIKYGVDNVMKLPETYNKAKHTCIEKYEVDNYLKLSEYQENYENILENSMITIDENGDLFIPYDEERINREFNYFLNTHGKITGISKYNYIIKFFQQNTFYKKEIELCKDNYIFNKIISNRIKYLKKPIEELTSEDILQGFKRSGIYYGYGHFNPLWIKWFYEKYDIKTCYDPCGGWGHRLLGSLNLDMYIYNDFSKTTYENINNIINHFELECITKPYNKDCRNFIPDEEFEAMFTCPPYFNLEHYECGDFNTLQEYNEFIDKLFDIFYNKKSCKYFGLVIREDYLKDKYKEKSNENILIDINRSQHISKGGKHNLKEYLYIYIKE